MSSRYVKKYVPSQQVEKTFVRDNRTEIFETKVTDKNLIQRNKLKTAMCKRMVETGSCNYGSSCFFAHHQSEIRKPICFFGQDCKNKDTCGYDHTSEVIPEMVPPPKVEVVQLDPQPLKKLKTYYDPIKPLPNDFSIEIEGEPTDTFKALSLDDNKKSKELEMLKSLMNQAEDNLEFQTIMCDTLMQYMTKTFNNKNTHFIPSGKNNKLKFIAVECDDDEFETLKEVIKEVFVSDENEINNI
jgi:hypothetical protein